MPLVAIAALLLRASASAVPVTLDTGVVSADRAIAALSAASGMSLRVSPVLAKYPLMLKVSGRAPEDILPRIARVLGGEWRKDGDGLMLGSDASALRRTEDRLVATLSTTLAARSAKLSALQFDEKFVASSRAASKAAQKQMMTAMSGGEMDPMALMTSFTEGPTSLSPGSKAIVSLLQAIGPRALAAMPLDGRVVLSMRPTRMQSPMPPGADRILMRLLADQQRLRAAQLASPAPKKDPSSDVFEGAGDFLFEMMTGTKAPTGVPTDALLVIERGDGMLTSELTIYDENGKAMANGSDYAATLNAAPSAPILTAEESRPVPLEPIGREWASKLVGSFDATSATSPEAMKGFFAPGAAEARKKARGVPLSAELRAQILDPVANEPSAPLFEPLARALPGDVVASVPDDGLSMLASSVVANEATTAKVVAALAGSSAFSVARADGAFEIAAATPARLRAAFADRSALRDLARAVAAAGSADREILGAYAVAQREKRGARALAQPILAILENQQASLMNTGGMLSSWEGYRVWGSLSPEAKASLLSGGKVSYASLSPESLAAIEADLFQSDEPLFDPTERSAPDEAVPDASPAATPEAPSEEPASPPMEEPAGSTDEAASEFDWSSAFGVGGTLGEERTVRFADGMPTSGFLSATLVKAETFRMRESATGATAFGDASAYGMSRAFSKTPFLASLGIAGNYDRFVSAREETTTLQFNYAPKAAASHQLISRIVTGERELTYEEMPAEFRKQVEDMSKMYDEMMSRAKTKTTPP